MYRSLIGALVGACCGFLVGYSIGYAQPIYYRRLDDGQALIFATILCGAGALTGAVVGGVGDVLAFLRRVHQNLPRTGPDADYRERT